MEMVSPSGPVYQAGTLSGNPVAMAAGLTQLKYLYAHPEVYTGLEKKGTLLYEGMKDLAEKAGLTCHLNHISSLGSIFFTEEKVCDYTSAKTSDTRAFSDYFQYMLQHGVHLAPSQFEAMFLSDAHTEEDIQTTLELIEGYF